MSTIDITIPAIENLGPHLLGHVGKADARDWRIEDFLGDEDPLVTALKVLQRSRGAAPATKTWAAAVTDRILSMGPAPAPAPDPAPTPDPTPTPEADTRVWQDPITLDQAQTGHCVGFTGADFANADPVMDQLKNKDGHAIYYECKVKDGEPGAEDGSSIHSLAAVLSDRGLVSGYAWASNMDEVVEWLLTKGTVLVGTNWTEGMFDPDAQGFIAPTGEVAGGHAYSLEGVHERKYFEIKNHWGASWGVGGSAYMKIDDFWGLVGDDPYAEMMVALQVAGT